MGVVSGQETEIKGTKAKRAGQGEGCSVRKRTKEKSERHGTLMGRQERRFSCKKRKSRFRHIEKGGEKKGLRGKEVSRIWTQKGCRVAHP